MIFISFSFLMVACSNDESKDSEASYDRATEDGMQEKNNNSIGGTDDSEQQEADSQGEDASSQEGEVSEIDRKIIYTANLHIEVKEYQEALTDIQTRVSERGGYIVESNMHQSDSEGGSTNGQITARIPQAHFQEFIDFVEEGSSKVLESSSTGEDVTEEYVDLESRLKSKRVVEERLLSFMEQAEETEDLLTISDDLATVQEAIEEVTGRMNYLQNKADLATVRIHIQEKNVTISGMNEGELNTWEKTKEQFLKSINFLLSAFSGLFVFFIGNLPVLILLGSIGLISILIIKRVKKRNQRN
ncbi:DUF4349 domain-containing protein [Virgibacillus byunsanensis]|uniref:DUF4349 domain-containing protein n=2 Tax=Virgibacillus byunsanensis TaxID=570945 RepID=A0ABW3LPW9_9BACI